MSGTVNPELINTLAIQIEDFETEHLRIVEETGCFGALPVEVICQANEIMVAARVLLKHADEFSGGADLTYAVGEYRETEFLEDEFLSVVEAIKAIIREYRAA